MDEETVRERLFQVWEAVRRAANRVAPQFAEDIAGDIVKSILGRWRRGGSERLDSFLRCLFAVAESGRLPRRLYREVQRRAIRTRRQQGTALETVPEPLAPIQESDGEEPFAKFMARLPNKWRIAWRLAAADYSHSEIAKQCEVCERTVRNWLIRIRKRAIEEGIRGST